MFQIILCFGGFFLSVVLAIVLENYGVLPIRFGVTIAVVFTLGGFSLGKWIDARIVRELERRDRIRGKKR